MEKILFEEKNHFEKKKVPFIFAKTTKQIEKKNIFFRTTENLSPLKKNNLLQKKHIPIFKKKQPFFIEKNFF